MNIKFCQECGGKMLHIETGEGHWQHRYQCSKCKVYCTLTCGDMGASDHIYWHKEKGKKL